MKKFNWLSSSIEFTRKLTDRHGSIKTKILNDPYYRFQNLTEIAIAAELGIKIDANRATLDDWLRLPGISIHQGRNLVKLTNMGVLFLSIEDLAAALNTSCDRLRPIEPILEFCYYDPQSTISPQRIDLNSATAQQLAELPFVDPDLCDRILENRQKYGNYRNLADFQRRLSLDGQLIGQLMHYLNF